MPFKLTGDISGNNVEVDSDKRLLVNLPTVGLVGPDGQQIDATKDGHLCSGAYR